MRVVIVDYDGGNLHSVQKAFDLMGRDQGAQIVVSSDPKDVLRADKIVLPGDGAFPSCKQALDQRIGLSDALHEAVMGRAVPFMGICVGMQLLASMGHEYTPTAGLDWIGGQVRAIPSAGQKVPHMGWNDLVVNQPHPVLNGIHTGDHAYFVHSWHFQVDNPAHVVAHVDYGGAITAIVGRDHLIATQFHPEKSQALGLRLIDNFLRWAP